MADIFREIDEELRQERFAQLWQRYGRYVIAAVVVFILAVAAFQGWHYWRDKQRNRESAQFSAAASLMSEGKYEDAAALFASLAEKGSDGYASLAKFNQATLRARGKDLKGAVDLFNAIADDGGLDSGLRDAATICAVAYGMELKGANTAALKKRLEPLVAGGGPWRHSAAELSALLDLRAGDTAGARTLLQKIADDADAPQSMRQRATEILAVIGA